MKMEDKILEKIYEIYSKRDAALVAYSAAFPNKGVTNVYPLPSGGIRISVSKFLRDCRIDFEELEKGMKQLRAEELIKDFRFVSDPNYICAITLPDTFLNLYKQKIKSGGGPSQEENQTRRIPRLKSGTQWKHCTFEFVDEEKLRVRIANGNKVDVELSYEDLGCKDKRKSAKLPLYDSQWRLLLRLARLGGEIVPKGEFFDKSNEKSKQELTARLQNYFGLYDDPFFPVEQYNNDKKKGSYKFRATIFGALAEDVDDTPDRDDLGREIDQELGRL
jgi:hypothetical protein